MRPFDCIVNGDATPFELNGGGRFTLSRQDFVPAYVKAFEEGVLHERAQQAIEALRSCRVCPRDCELAQIMLDLQRIGCHNINFVTPEHVVPQILEALVIAVERGLRLPLVYNTSAYDSLESIHWMNGVVDIYMPDFKLWDPEHCRKYLVASDYTAAARKVIAAMH